MANRLSEEKARLIASIYCTNGYNKVKALLDAGYKTTYANNVGLKLYENSRVKEAIARITSAEQIKTDYTCDFVRQELLSLLDDCKAADDRTNRKATLELLARHKSMLTDNVASTITKPDDLSVDDINELQELASTAVDTLTFKRDVV
jgi:hypothetical protein